jgi:hypothetical protein
MIDILESVRRTIYRWVNTNVALTEDAPYNTTTLKVTSSIRFKAGDEVALHNGVDGEPGLRIYEVPDNNTIILETPIQVITGWRVSNNAMLTKTYNGQFMQAIYIGEPDVIPMYPAITILGQKRSSEWFTLGTTKERYSLQIAIYSAADNHEDSYRTVMQLADIIQLGLKKNIFPLVGQYETTTITADIAAEDTFIKVADSSIFQCEDKIVVENIYQAEELRVAAIPDSTTIQVFPNPHFPYLVSEQTKVIRLTRFIYNSWPSDIEYGFKYKGTLLHAASISWFAEEQEIQTRHGWSDPQLS